MNKPHSPVHGLDVARVTTTLRKPFEISSTYKWLTVAMVILGIFISVEWRAPVAKSPVTANYPREISKETIARLEAEQKDLKAMIADKRGELSAIQKDASSRKSTLADLNSQLVEQRVLAGMTALAGPGVQIVLDDSTAKSIPAGEDPNHFIVHDYDVRDVVSLLWQAGAEAVAISDERIVGTTSIYCVGSTILVNDTRMSPPYKIVAIGPAAMEEALNSASNLQMLKSDVKQYSIQFKVTNGKDLQVPAYTGSFSGRFAKPGASR